VAVNWSVIPVATLDDGAVTVIDASTAALTVKLKTGEEVMPFVLAVMLVLPMATPVANPWVPAVLLMVAAAVFDECHVTALVRSCVEPSE
jgi:ABC-type transport system involved in cytochrome c biogenesis permease component